MTTASTQYTKTAVVLHWLIAAAIIFQLVLGLRLGDAPKGAVGYAMFQLHKSIGFTILFLSLTRLGWRLMHKPPALPNHMKTWEKSASHLVHMGLYVIMIGLPITGWIAVSTSKITIPTVLYGLVPMPHLPFLSELAAPVKTVVNDIAGAGHGLLVLLTVVLLFLHLGAVLKHQILVKDDVFARMALGARTGITEPRLWLVGIFGLAILLSAYFYMPTIKAAPVAAVVMDEPLANDEPATVNTEPLLTATTEPSKTVSPVVAEVAKTIMPLSHWLVAKNSQLGFSTVWTGEPIVGGFKRWTADIAFSPDELEKSVVTVNVDLASVSTGDEQRDSALPSADWFDVEHHPSAIFSASKFTKVAEGRYKAKGELTLRGTKAPLALMFEFDIVGDKGTIKGETTLDRTLFGVGQGDYAATDQIPAAVKVSFKLMVTRKS